MALERDLSESFTLHQSPSQNSFISSRLSQLSHGGQSLQKLQRTGDDKDKVFGNLLNLLTKDVKKRLITIDRKLDMLPAIDEKLNHVSNCLASQHRLAGATLTNEEQSTAGGQGGSATPAKFRPRSHSVPHLPWQPTLAPLGNSSDSGSRQPSKRTIASEIGSLLGEKRSTRSNTAPYYSSGRVVEVSETSSAHERSSNRHLSHHSTKSAKSARINLDLFSLDLASARSANQVNGNGHSAAAVVPGDVSPSRSASGASSNSTTAKKLKHSVSSSYRSRSATSQWIWNFLEDSNSSTCAFIYASTIPVLIMMSVFASLMQTTEPPVLSGIGAAVIETSIDCIFAFEITLRFIVYPSRITFFFNTKNLIDMLVALPLILRAIIGFKIDPSSEAGWEREVLLCVVPMLRLLKMMRRFEKFHLLLKAMEICAEALPVMLFTLLVIAWSFSSLIYIVEPRSNIDSLPRAMWLTIVTMTTVGYGDVVPVSGEGSIIVATLVISSVLYMAMPIGIIGHAFTQIWVDRDQILLTHRTRDVFDKWGYTAGDISKLFRLFDEDGNGKLSLNEFRKMIEAMSIGLSDRRVVQLFEAFEDKGQQGIIDERTFVRILFPNSFHDLYSNEKTGEKARRSSWLPFTNVQCEDPDELEQVQENLEDCTSQGPDDVESLNTEAADSMQSQSKP